MKVHELLEACVEYVAMDGVLGTDPLSVQRYLESLDASVDTASFSHIYRLLSRHPSVLISISTTPLTLPDGSVQLGTAPLPTDYVPPDPSRRANIDFFALFDAGTRGVQMAKMLRGDEAYDDYIQGARARKEREEEGLGKEQRRALREKRLLDRHGMSDETMQIKGQNGEVLFTILEDDDAALNRKGEEAVIKEDLAGLMQKWGSRLRIRCTDDEVYFRLTGTHTRLGKVTKPVLQTLQFSARSREKGITAIELGPLLKTSQGTMFYLMKVLVELGLCFKLPMIQHGSTTHLLVFHKYLEQNASYRSMKQLPPLPAVRPRLNASNGDDDAEDDQTGNAQGLDIDRTPLTESDLMAGIIPKQRLIQILDHPGLTNHLLRDKNLLELLGWNSPYATRHRRSLLRHINSLAAAGVVERLLVGQRGVDCLRLTKYNPDYQKARSAPVIQEAPEEIISFDPNAFSEPLNPLGGINATRSLEHVVLQIIENAGDEGLTHAQIREQSGNPYRRFIEFYVDRTANLWVPDSLAGHGIRELMENAGKERRLRVYGEAAYQRHLKALGQATEEPAVPPEQVGVFADVSYRQYVRSAAEQQAILSDLAEGKDGGDTTANNAARKGPVARTKGRPRNTAVSLVADPNAAAPPAKEMRYAEGSIQIRGRPRKYLYVVEPEGTVNRKIIGQVLSREDLVPVWIYLKDENVLVPAPIEFTGLGDVPKVTEEMMQRAKEPEWFRQFANANNAKQGGQKKEKQVKATVKGKTAAKGGKGKEAEVVVIEDGENGVAAAKTNGTADATAEATPGPRATGSEVTAGSSNQAAQATSKANKRKLVDTEESSSNSKSRKTAETPTQAADASTEAPAVRRSGRARASVPIYTAPGEDYGQEAVEEVAAAESGPRDAEGVGAPVDNLPVLVEPSKRALSPRSNADEAQKRRRVDDVPASAVVPRNVTASQVTLPPVDSTAPTVVPPAPRFSVRIPEELPVVQPRKAPLQAAEVRWRRALATAPPPRARIDLGLVRRMNELIETLKEGGGILVDSRHIQVHKAWAERVAGTDAPHAPRAAYGMDRQVYKHAIARMETQGRIKRTTAMVQVIMGRLTPQDVIYLPEKSVDEVNAYCLTLREEASQAAYGSQRHPSKVEIEAQAFTRLAVAEPAGVVGTAKVRPLADNADRPGTTRRNMLLRESHVGAMLMGWQPGQQARARTLHIEMCRIARQRESRNVIATSPSIVLLSLLLEDISVGTFFQCIWTSYYDEGLDQWLHTGDNASTPLKDMPERYRSSAGFNSQSSKAKLKTLLATLTDLQVITPLVPCPKARAELSAETVDARSGRHFATASAVGKATHLLLHSVAPLYHVADQPSRLLGSLPLTPAEEVDTYWQRSQQVAISMDFARIGPMQPVTAAWPDIAKYTESMAVPDERLRFLGMWARWQGDIRLLNQQNHAINRLANQPEVELADEDLDQFAYENALPVAFVRSELPRRRDAIAKRQARAAQQKLEAEEAFRKRHAAAQQTLRAKMQQRRDEIRRTWEARIQSIARDAGVEFSEQLVGFMNRRVVAMSKANITDKTIYEIVRLSIKQMGTEEDVQEQQDEMPMPMPLPLPMGKRKMKAPLTPAQRLSRSNPGGFAEPAAPGKRRRFYWNPELDELLIDAEAVIRARAVGRPLPGRKAMAGLGQFGDVPYGSIRVRLCRVLSDPVKNAYFQKLIMAWRAMWLERRGTPELPDPDFNELVDFPIKQHVEYMRKHIVKADLSAAPSSGSKQVTTTKVPDLPQTVEEMLERHGWEYPVSKKAYMAVMWEGLAEEQRMAILMGTSFTAEEVPPRPALSRESGMIRGMLKTIISTPNESYARTPCVQQLERYALQDQINPELAAMMDAKQVNAQHTASSTGRFYSYSAIWDGLTEGPIQSEMFAQASKLHRKLVNSPDGYDLPVIAEGGEYAELFQMVSDGSVELDVDIGKMSIVRKTKGTFNTRKMNDAGFEMPLKLRLTHPTPPIDLGAPNPQAVPPNLTTWPLPSGIQVDEELVQQIQTEIDNAGPNGVDKAELYSSDIDSSSIDIALAKLTSHRPATVFWAGYDTARIVSSKHALAWMQPVSTTTGTAVSTHIYCAPRRWVDMFGNLLQDDLDKSIRGAMAHIMTRPGISEDNLRRRLSAVMDRQEITDILSMLAGSRVAVRCWARDPDRMMPPVEAIGVGEESQIVWHPVAAWCT